MTEIKLTKRYPHSRTEDIVDAYMRGWNDALDAVQNGKFHIADRKIEPQSDAEEIAKDTNRRVDMVKKEWSARHIEDEPTGYNLSPVETMSCQECKWWSDLYQRCCQTHIGNDCKYEPKDEPQFDKDINVRSKDEPQIHASWGRVKGGQAVYVFNG